MREITADTVSNMPTDPEEFVMPAQPEFRRQKWPARVVWATVASVALAYSAWAIDASYDSINDPVWDTAAPIDEAVDLFAAPEVSFESGDDSADRYKHISDLLDEAVETAQEGNLAPELLNQVLATSATFPEQVSGMYDPSARSDFLETAVTTRENLENEADDDFNALPITSLFPLVVGLWITSTIHGVRRRISKDRFTGRAENRQNVVNKLIEGGQPIPDSEHAFDLKSRSQIFWLGGDEALVKIHATVRENGDEERETNRSKIVHIQHETANLSNT